MANEPQDEFEEDEVDIEELVKQGKRVPRARRYRIRIDREKFVVEKPVVTGPELLRLVGKSPDKWRIHQKLKGGQLDEVKPGETVDLREKGVERFVTMELTQTDGEEAAHEAPPARRDFNLPEEDTAFLNSLGLPRETVKDGKALWVFVHKFPIPEGFNVAEAILAIRIPGGYPPAKLDMACFSPALSRANGGAIPALSPITIDKGSFQQWSRHYDWREGVDSLASHYRHVQQWLVEELKR